ncbi:unnamed protein product [Lampetra planeri]
MVAECDREEPAVEERAPELRGVESSVTDSRQRESSAAQPAHASAILFVEREGEPAKSESSPSPPVEIPSLSSGWRGRLASGHCCHRCQRPQSLRRTPVTPAHTTRGCAITSAGSSRSLNRSTCSRCRELGVGNPGASLASGSALGIAGDSCAAAHRWCRRSGGRKDGERWRYDELSRLVAASFGDVAKQATLKQGMVSGPWGSPELPSAAVVPAPETTRFPATISPTEGTAGPGGAISREPRGSLELPLAAAVPTVETILLAEGMAWPAGTIWSGTQGAASGGAAGDVCRRRRLPPVQEFTAAEGD